MKNFILLLTFVTIVSVKCDLDLDLNELRLRINKEFTNRTEIEIRARVERDVSTICALIRAQESGLHLQGLEFMVEMYENRSNAIESQLSNIWPIMDEERDERTRLLDYTLFGSTVASALGVSELVVNWPLNVSDSEENLHKKYSQEKARILEILELTIYQAHDKLKGVEYWVGAVHHSLSKMYKEFAEYLGTVESSDLRAKNLQFIINEMQFFIFVHSPH